MRCCKAQCNMSYPVMASSSTFHLDKPSSSYCPALQIIIPHKQVSHGAITPTPVLDTAIDARYALIDVMVCSYRIPARYQ